MEGRGRENRCVGVIFCPGAGLSRGVELSRRIQGREKQEFVEISAGLELGTGVGKTQING